MIGSRSRTTVYEEFLTEDNEGNEEEEATVGGARVGGEDGAFSELAGPVGAEDGGRVVGKDWDLVGT